MLRRACSVHWVGWIINISHSILSSLKPRGQRRSRLEPYRGRNPIRTPPIFRTHTPSKLSTRTACYQFYRAATRAKSRSKSRSGSSRDTYSLCNQYNQAKVDAFRSGFLPEQCFVQEWTRKIPWMGFLSQHYFWSAIRDRPDSKSVRSPAIAFLREDFYKL